MRRRTYRLCLAAAISIAAAALPGHSATISSTGTATGPTPVRFDSADGQSPLIGYLYVPAGTGPFPAVVMLHGRSGLYSRLPGSSVSAASLSVRHRYWARFLANAGYVTLLVDSFASRGYPTGFERGTYSQRPAAVSDQTVRPLDAYGAEAFLRRRPDVIADRIGLFGWSNGGMSALALVTGAVATPSDPTSGGGFRAAIALYPGCFIPEQQRAVPKMPLLLLIAAEDDEVSPERCARWAEAVGASTPDFVWHLMPGAAHNFDGLALGTRAGPADMAAALRAEALVKAFLEQQLRAAPAGSGTP